jgi:hypothetical protein
MRQFACGSLQMEFAGAGKTKRTIDTTGTHRDDVTAGITMAVTIEGSRQLSTTSKGNRVAKQGDMYLDAPNLFPHKHLTPAGTNTIKQILRELRVPGNRSAQPKGYLDQVPNIQLPTNTDVTYVNGKVTTYKNQVNVPQLAILATSKVKTDGALGTEEKTKLLMQIILCIRDPSVHAAVQEAFDAGVQSQRHCLFEWTLDQLLHNVDVMGKANDTTLEGVPNQQIRVEGGALVNRPQWMQRKFLTAKTVSVERQFHISIKSFAETTTIGDKTSSAMIKWASSLDDFLLSTHGYGRDYRPLERIAQNAVNNQVKHIRTVYDHACQMYSDLMQDTQTDWVNLETVPEKFWSVAEHSMRCFRISLVMKAFFFADEEYGSPKCTSAVWFGLARIRRVITQLDLQRASSQLAVTALQISTMPVDFVLDVPRFWLFSSAKAILNDDSSFCRAPRVPTNTAAPLFWCCFCTPVGGDQQQVTWAAVLTSKEINVETPAGDNKLLDHRVYQLQNSSETRLSMGPIPYQGRWATEQEAMRLLQTLSL